MIKEHERVVLTADFPEHGFKAGDVGVIVMMHGDGAGYEVEIFALDSRTLDVITVEAGQCRRGYARPPHRLIPIGDVVDTCH